MQVGENVTTVQTREGKEGKGKGKGKAIFRDRPTWLEKSPRGAMEEAEISLRASLAIE